jgi:hypothetical protein
MGDVFWGLHTPLAARLGQACDLHLAVETGSHFGFGALQLSAMFDRVWSIDADNELVDFVRDSYQVENLRFLCGDSALQLAEVLRVLDQPTLFVLDAHWFPMSSRAQFVPDNRCPVIEELRVIHSRAEISDPSVIMIDDAQMFLGSLKQPWRRSDFPSIDVLLDRLNEHHPYVTVTDDVIIAGPDAAREAVDAYLVWRDRLAFP